MDVFTSAAEFLRHRRPERPVLALRPHAAHRAATWFLANFPGSYAAYRRRKDEILDAEALHSRKFDKLLAQEEAWIRKGIEARRTRNEGRVRRLEALRRERADPGIDESGNDLRRVVRLRGVQHATRKVCKKPARGTESGVRPQSKDRPLWLAIAEKLRGRSENVHPMSTPTRD